MTHRTGSLNIARNSFEGKNYVCIYSSIQYTLRILYNIRTARDCGLHLFFFIFIPSNWGPQMHPLLHSPLNQSSARKSRYTDICVLSNSFLSHTPSYPAVIP